MLLPLRVTEGKDEVEPWRPCTAAPPEALMLLVLHLLKDVEDVEEPECDSEEEELALIE